MSGRPGTVLIYRALGLGDLLTALPALEALRRAFPRSGWCSPRAPRWRCWPYIRAR